MSSEAAFPSHEAFADAARSFVEAHSHLAASRPATTNSLRERTRTVYQGWRWVQPTGPYARGYLMRSRLVRLALTAARRLPADSSRSPDQVVVSLPADPMIADEEDPSTAICPPAATEMLQITCHIVFSSTYRRPQMLCSAHSQGNGTPASLETLVASGLLRPPGLAAPNEEGIAIELAPETANGAAFPLLGLAEHPTTGAAMWALHPCHLAEVVEEIFAAESPHGPARTGRRFLETWLMVVGSVLDLSTGS